MLSQKLETITHRFAKWAGSGGGFVVALLSIIVWLVVGESLSFSHRWEAGLTIYIGVITFMMIFIVQRGLNKELSALHVKLNELICATTKADNRMINAEVLTEKEILEVQEMHRRIVVDAEEKNHSA